jgi:uncharacterized protein (TIGR03118 family)
MAVDRREFEALGGSILNDDARRCGNAGQKSTGACAEAPNESGVRPPEHGDVPGSRSQESLGIAFSSTSPFWVADNATSVSTLYNSAGTKQGLTVTTPPQPTGIVFNSTASFNSDLPIFATENGVIAGWRGALGTIAETLSTTPGAVYKGLAIGTTAGGTYLYAADFRGGHIDVTANSGAPSSPYGSASPTNG